MRVVFVNTSRTWGGNEKWTLESLKGLSSRGNETCLVCDSGLLADRADDLGIETFRLRLVNDADIVSLLRFAAFLRGARPGAVVLTRTREYWLGGLASRIARVPFVVARIGIDRKVRDTIKDRIVFGSLIDKIVVNSLRTCDSLTESNLINKDRIRVIYNGVGVAGPAAVSREEIRNRLGVRGDELLLGTSGRLIRRKGVDVLLEAAGRIMPEDRRLKLVFLGEGPLRQEILDFADKRGLTGRILTAGFVENTGDWLPALDMFILPSTAEGISNSLLEAMSCGIPSIATRAGGHEEAIEDGETGFLVDAGDTETICARIKELASRPELRQAVGLNGRNMVEKKFSMERMLSELETLLASGMKGPAA